jgi:membrane-bound lytic murein transglycosylase D
MLKTQFAKAFYLCSSLLLITTSFTASPLASRTISFPEEKNGKASASAISDYNEPEIKLNRKGVQFVKRYIKNSSECLVSIKKRSMIPFSIIDSVFNLYDLPVELKYLAVIESELKPTALSHVGARGPWQFMPGTAHILGLKINSHYDERTNYCKSTIAAARYLKDLYAQFNDWLLVLAAYNAGPKPVYTAIRKTGSRNFWVLQDCLPSESRDHVKKFIATHYYFEGRGSETTLTRSENAAYKKLINEFVKSRKSAQYSEPIDIRSENINIAQKNWETNFNMKQIDGFDNAGINYTLQKYPNIANQFESSEQKFTRLMKESGESLRKSRKII